jgi:ParB family chromosome partitioning protein
LISEFHMTHAAAAEAVGRSRTAVTNLLRLLELSDEVKTLVEQRDIEMGHARALLSLENKRQQADIAAQVADKKLSVRETEALVRRLQAHKAESSAAAKVDPNTRKLEAELSEKLGAKVQVQHSSSGQGKLVISYHSLEELDGIIEHIR